MISNEIKKEVLKWIVEGCDYQAGVALYTRYGKNQFLKRDFPAHQNRYSTKIIPELCKSVGLDYQKLKADIQFFIANARMQPIAPSSTPPAPGPMLLAPGSNSKAPAGEHTELEAMPETIEAPLIQMYPAIIRRVIFEYAETFQERSKTHRIMTEMPEGNSQALKTKRVQLFDIVKSLTERLELLYDAQEVYKSTGFVPEESAIWPTPKEKAQTILPDDMDLLRKMKKNQQSANTKDQSLLDYQSEKQGEVKRPMPNGPKRMKLENRIKARLKMIEEIDYKLLKL